MPISLNEKKILLSLVKTEVEKRVLVYGNTDKKGCNNDDLSLFQLENIAHSLNVDSSTLRRKISRCFNITGVALLHRLRLKIAKRHLMSNKRLSEVAHLSGYREHERLSKAFKDYCGESPSGYRKRILS